jgi:glutamate-ammonia-ligase adenylyltransferase
MNLPLLVEIPAVLTCLVSRNRESFKAAVATAGFEMNGVDAALDWPEVRWQQWDRVTAASDFVLQQAIQNPAMLLELLASGDLDRGFNSGELREQIARAVEQAGSEDELARVLRRQRAPHTPS